MSYIIDHYAIRTLDKEKCVKFFVDALGYKVQETFPIYFNDEKTDMANCTVLQPGNRVEGSPPWEVFCPWQGQQQRYVLDYEIFVSEGSPGSIVHNWAEKRGGSGIHHIALQVPEFSTIEKEVQKWKDNGWAEQGFSTEEPIVCPQLKQIFTRPSCIGVIFELIERHGSNFCRENVKELMQSTKND